MTKLDELKNDSAFMDRVLEIETPDGLAALFAEKGIELSAEEAKYAYSVFQGVDEDEMTIDDLSNVSGGVPITITAGALIVIALIGFARGARCKK